MTQNTKDKKTLRHKGTKTNRHKDKQTQRQIDTKTNRHKDKQTQRQKDKRTKGHKGLTETQRHKVTKTQTQIDTKKIVSSNLNQPGPSPQRKLRYKIIINQKQTKNRFTIKPNNPAL